MFKHKKNKELGITLIVLVVTIIVLLILAGIGIAMILGNNGILKRVENARDQTIISQEKEKHQLNEFDEMIEGMGNENEIIPIRTAEQLLKIGSGEKIIIDNKEYIMSKYKKYDLQNNITFTGDYSEIAQLIQNKKIVFYGNSNKIVVKTTSGTEEYYTESSKYYIATNKYGYVLNGLILYYDGKDNTGTGVHSNTVSIWKDLSENNNDGILNNFGTNAISGWNNEYLSFDGINDWVNCGEINLENITLEATYAYKTDTSEGRSILGNWENGGIGLSINGKKFISDVYINNYNFQKVDIIDKNIIFTQALTYDGEKEKTFINGEEKISSDLIGNIQFPRNNTVMGIGGNANGSMCSVGMSDIDVYAIRIYDRGLTNEEMEINNKTDEQRFKNREIIPIYTEEQLLRVGSGESVNINGTEYIFEIGKKYELKNDIIITGNYDFIINKINNKEVELVLNDKKIINNGVYYTNYSKYTIASNKYGYVAENLQLLLDGFDNIATGVHSNNTAIWKDLSGNNRDGVLRNTIKDWDNDGLNFDGIDDYVSIAPMNYSNVTLETVITTKNINNNKIGNIISNVEAGGYRFFLRTNNYIRFQAYVKELSSYSSIDGVKINAGQKYSISGMYNGQEFKQRSNRTYSEVKCVGTIKNTQNNSYICLGTNPTGSRGNDEWYKGKICSTRVYNRTLTDEELAVNNGVDSERFEL